MPTTSTAKNSPAAPDRPTAKQLHYLKDLAAQAGQSFAYPATVRAASDEIHRLKAVLAAADRGLESATARRERRDVSRDLAQAGGDARVRDHELAGHGAGARWAGDENPPPRTAPTVGPRVELARYRVSAGSRVLYGQRVDGVVRVIDKPQSGAGRSFLVERGLSSNAELQALVADYVAQSVEQDQPAVLAAADREEVSDDA